MTFGAEADIPVYGEGPAPPSKGPAPQRFEYVAMGDSFSSGEGNPEFLDTLEPKCHQSRDYSYPRMLAAVRPPRTQSDVNLAMFLACSGAVMSNLYLNVQPDRPGLDGSQFSYLRRLPAASVDLVTLSIMGNDVPFQDFIVHCAFPWFDCFGDPERNAMDSIRLQQPDLVDVLGLLVASAPMKPTTRIFIVGYPYLTVSDAKDKCLIPGDRDVVTGHLVDLSVREQLAAHLVVDALDNTIRRAVQEVNAKGLGPQATFVDPRVGSGFVGHELCSAKGSYFTALNIDTGPHKHRPRGKPSKKDEKDLTYSFHPNRLGQGAYRDLLLRSGFPKS
jgi:hypothetical protein